MIAALWTVACAEPIVVARRRVEQGPLAWQQHAYVKSPMTIAGDHFGASVVAFDERLLVGVPGSRSTGAGFDVRFDRTTLTGSGMVAIVHPTTSSTTLLKGPSPGRSDMFGAAVDAWGDTFVVGARSRDATNELNAGAVYVYEPSNAASGWSWIAKLDGPPLTNGGFGVAVAIHEDVIVVGEVSACPSRAPGCRSRTGIVHVFERRDEWERAAALAPDGAETIEQFGASVSVHRDVLVGGAPAESSCATGVDPDRGDDDCRNAGAAYVFENDGGIWRQAAYLKSTTATVGRFGSAVVVEDDLVVVGAPAEGAAYVYERDQDGYRFVERLTPEGGEPVPSFGAALALRGGVLLVGAPMEDGCGRGVDRPDDGEDCWDSGRIQPGAAFLYERTDGGFESIAYLKPSNTTSHHEFGAAVDIGEHFLAVGAPGERGCSSGVDGDEQQLFCSDAGAVFLFALEEVGP